VNGGYDRTRFTIGRRQQVATTAFRSIPARYSQGRRHLHATEHYLTTRGLSMETLDATSHA